YVSSFCIIVHHSVMVVYRKSWENSVLFSRSIDIITDSRSFLSYPRHEYFRRLVCNLLGDDVRRGLLPDDREALGRIAQDVSFFNAREYLGLELGRIGRDVARVAA